MRYVGLMILCSWELVLRATHLLLSSSSAFNHCTSITVLSLCYLLMEYHGLSWMCACCLQVARHLNLRSAATVQQRLQNTALAKQLLLQYNVRLVVSVARQYADRCSSLDSSSCAQFLTEVA